MRCGIDLGGTKTEAVVMDDVGEIVWRMREATPAERGAFWTPWKH